MQFGIGRELPHRQLQRGDRGFDLPQFKQRRAQGLVRKMMLLVPPEHFATRIDQAGKFAFGKEFAQTHERRIRFPV
ncbi:MAG: hypothetical protein WC000_14310 [Dokdonella sp.]